MSKIVDQQIKWIEETNEHLLTTEFADGKILVETLSLEEATKWQAENGF